MPISKKHRELTQAEEQRTRKKKHSAARGSVLAVVLVVGFLYFLHLLTGGSAAEPAAPASSATPPPLMGEEADAAASAQAKRECPWNLLVVSAAQPLSQDFTVNLEEVPGGRVDTRCAADLRAMLAQAAADGVTITITSSYRSVTKQEQLYRREVSHYKNLGYGADESRKKTEQHTQPPGGSEHHTGLAVDLITPGYRTLDEGFATTAAGEWLRTHAATYGFILRYPKGKETMTGVDFEPWHYRYVGKKDAALLTDAGLCLEEYVVNGVR